jgi:hypothetical protein
MHKVSSTHAISGSVSSKQFGQNIKFLAERKYIWPVKKISAISWQT